MSNETDGREHLLTGSEWGRTVAEVAEAWEKSRRLALKYREVRLMELIEDGVR